LVFYLWFQNQPARTKRPSKVVAFVTKILLQFSLQRNVHSFLQTSQCTTSLCLVFALSLMLSCDTGQRT
jgi:hypothetical protein